MNSPGPPGHVVILGVMGAGKTTTGSALAERLGWALCDSDHEIEARTGTSGADLAARDGVDALHALEARILLDALDAPEPSVVTAAASIVDSPPCRAALAATALVVWLEAPLDVVIERWRSGSHRRPVARAAAEAALQERSRHYAEVADLRLDATTPTVELVETIIGELERSA